MLYQGKTLGIEVDDDRLAWLVFDMPDSAVNTLSQQVVAELMEAVSALESMTECQGLVLASAKKAFIVGADIKEFHAVFGRGAQAIEAMCQEVHALYNRIEDLPFPTVAVINGMALGGGMELCLACDFRIVEPDTRIGLPETKLGIVPGWGGCVRLPRLIGADNAIEWIAGGGQHGSDAALRVGAVDAVVASDDLRDAAADLLKRAWREELPWQPRRRKKTSPLLLNSVDQMLTFETAKGMVASKAGRHYPAPVAAVDVIRKGAGEDRLRAQAIETDAFVRLAQTDVCYQLVGLFESDQRVKKQAAAHEKSARDITLAGVLGAGIMGGGIAYQSASKGTSIMMKDIRNEALELGLSEARKLVGKQLERGKFTADQSAEVLGRIRPTLSYGDFSEVDIVVEAVVENAGIKASVLAEVEQTLGEQAILASNTSTISIDRLAGHLSHPERFCGMHFFNPVHRMPLVEVIRGARTDEATLGTVVAYARKMGKTPIVVNDCPGFLVNRVLFPYLQGFELLLRRGIDMGRIDRIMEKFGWPMGPAYLLDVVGLDTAAHAGAVLAEGYPDRMANDGVTAVEKLLEMDRKGQKNGKGFYRYEKDKKGKPKKETDPDIQELLTAHAEKQVEMSDEEIIAALMTPLCLETVRALEEGVVGSPAEADMALIYGIGFPPFRGGALRYIDHVGLSAFVRQARALADTFGPLYAPTAELEARAAEGRPFYRTQPTGENA
ncbi:fatty acid oxidation complex subunit alpha FadB [Larsenimonas rhizosphaerae]|uniref:enoyl-CoA hydratase n=1 Tax=Larsenimonas rhizosphaerae TaxID=2944682 RepID=A0AA42CU23_9GAMM|nr:fatty acid oxidation complex subunit alpha FadB [Larsenimonas rhizosphaerae]MCX2523879.1 fatty acid oxidation complex subunit alpha FadB [Larsenimonas rhizosphaerae]